MSRIGRRPIPVPAGVTVTIKGQSVAVKGPRGELSVKAPASTKLTFDEGSKQIQVDRAGNSKQARSNHGLVRSLVANMIQGVDKGYEKRLEIYGTGYNCKLQGNVLHMNVGFSGRRRGVGSQFELPVPSGVEVQVEVPQARSDTDPAKLVVRGTDKQAVGQFAAEIRKLRRTEPYKGKGVRYEGEYIKRKQGKALAGG